MLKSPLVLSPHILHFNCAVFLRALNRRNLGPFYCILQALSHRKSLPTLFGLLAKGFYDQFIAISVITTITQYFMFFCWLPVLSFWYFLISSLFYSSLILFNQDPRSLDQSSNFWILFQHCFHCRFIVEIYLQIHFTRLCPVLSTYSCLFNAIIRPCILNPKSIVTIF